jgi:hypothetical protein
LAAAEAIDPITAQLNIGKLQRSIDKPAHVGEAGYSSRLSRTPVRRNLHFVQELQDQNSAMNKIIANQSAFAQLLEV